VGDGITGRSVSAPSLHLSRGENLWQMAQMEGRRVTWKDRTPNGSEVIAKFSSEENWWNGTNSRSQLK